MGPGPRGPSDFSPPGNSGVGEAFAQGCNLRIEAGKKGTEKAKKRADRDARAKCSRWGLDGKRGRGGREKKKKKEKENRKQAVYSTNTAHMFDC